MAVNGRVRLALACATTAAIVLPLGWAWQASLLPDSYDPAEMGYADWGGGPAAAQAAHHGTPVTDLTADPDATPDVSATLTVRDEGERYTVNGTSPGPELRATVGDLVEVTLVNDNVTEGTTLHWHGIDVPNAADGVAGVTQDAVGPGEEFVYRFVADHAGTFWYHSHQLSHQQVQRGLLGAVVIEPDGPPSDEVDTLALLHLYDGVATLNGEEGTAMLEAQAGDRVRLRIVNTDNGLAPVWVTGTDFTVLAVDGTDVHKPGVLRDTTVPVPAGGRVDLGFTVPATGVRVDFAGSTAMVAVTDPTPGAVARACRRRPPSTC